MRIEKVTSGLIAVNTYFIICDDKRAIVIDGGEDYALIKNTAKRLGINITHELLTHAHFDHSGNACYLQKDGVKVGISEKDAVKLNEKDSLAKSLGIKYQGTYPDFTFSDGDILDINGLKIRVMITPGHTDGSACFIIDDVIFSGDTLFFESYGRTDFPTGNEDDMKKSVQRILSLKGNYRVLPGHDEETSLEHERKYNPLRKIC